MTDTSNALSINWSFGFSKDVVGGVESLTTPERNAIFYVSSHSGVIYDYENRTQIILQGHCNSIVCVAVSKDKRWIVTADTGDDAILVVWDSLSGAPVKTLVSPNKRGVISVDISQDALFICALSNPEPGIVQEVTIWAWTKESDAPILRKNILSKEPQHSIRFDPQKQSEFSTTGAKTVCFWTWEEFSLEGYIGKVSKTDFGHYSGKFTTTVFLTGTDTVITATDEGYIIIWETQYATVLLEDPSDKFMRTASKVIRLVECGIVVMSIINGYVVLGCSDGTVRFYDYSLRLEAWFEDMAAGRVTSVSFAVQQCPFAPGEGGSPGLQFWVPDFIVGTADAFIVGMESSVFQEVRVEDRRGTLLVQGMSDDVSALSCHPSRPLLAIACYNGSVQIWDYEMKLLMNLREFTANSLIASTKDNTKKNATAQAPDAVKTEILRPQCLAFDPSGDFLAVGFTSGHLKLLRTDSFEDAMSYAPTPDTIVGMRFSSTGAYMAAYDSSHHVLIFRRSSMMGSTASLNEDNRSSTSKVEDGNFVYLGRAKAHRAAITGLEFGTRDGQDVLVSVGEDRRCVEFNLEECSVKQGISIKDIPVKIDLTARPTAMLWHPRIGADTEDRFLLANDEFKFKEYNAESKQCRRTTLAPTFGGPVNRLLSLSDNIEDDSGGSTSWHYYVYSTAERVVGLGCFPLTGNPRKVMGLVAHPSRISGMALSYDGLYLFTSGGPDLITNMWAIDTQLFRDASGSGVMQDEPLGPYLELLEGGENGELHNDIIDYFYYCQLRSQGEDCMDPRKISGRVVLEELPALMRAVGYYPTEEEISNMVSEVRYKHFMESGEAENDITLSDFIKLYVNHRPVVPLSNVHIEAAFAEIRNRLYPSGHQIESEIDWSDLKKLLTTEGEIITGEDLELCLSALLGDEAQGLEGCTIDSRNFAEHVLGFDDFGGADGFEEGH